MSRYKCHRRECTRIRSEFSIFLNRRRPPTYEGKTFCSDSCLLAHFEEELTDKWRRLQLNRKRIIPRPKLGTILMQTAFITRDQLEEAIRLQKQMQAGRLGEWLLRLGFVDEHQITVALAQQCGLPLINLKNSDANSEAIRMIPGKIAKCSGLIPVGFDDDRELLRVAVCAPVDFHSQEAIRRMINKGIAPYVGEQSDIHKLLERWYSPEDLDLSNVPIFGSLEELKDVVKNMVAVAIEGRAQNIQAELIQDVFWMRLDFPSESHHHFFRFDSSPFQCQKPVSKGEVMLNYALGS